ncbi:spore cortex-lytic enzyme [Xylanibacillus composti]
MKQKVFVSFIALMLAITGILPESAQAATVLKSGSANGDVWDVQYRLKVLGYYQQPLDGKYGRETIRAVQRFQQDYGLPGDGITGAQTWKALRKYTLNREEMDILAKTIYSEGRGEPYIGQVAIGAVVMNRIQSSEFPNTIRGVVFQPRAFTAVDDGQFWLTPNATAYRAAEEAVRGWDPSGEALFYYNPRTATNAWIRTRPAIKTIGNHIFTM